MLLRHRMPRHRARIGVSAQPLLHLVPNMLTLMSLCAGLTSIRYAMDGRFELAVALIGVAVVLDGLDGRSARMLNLTSRLGAQLDSLADFLSFGVAPAVLVYLWTLHDVRGIGWAIAMLFATCCALRLARFNTELDLPDRPRWTCHFFTGMPAPAGAGLALTPVMLSFATGQAWPQAWPLHAVFLLLVAVMMVSRVPTFSIKRVRVAPRRVLPVLLLAFAVIAALVVETWLTLSLMGILYLASIPLSLSLARRMRRQEDEARAAGPTAGGTLPAGEGAQHAAVGLPPRRAARQVAGHGG
jgi:CDP-diacylglycerol--serine O-phosphatidyltransferase